MKAPKLLPLKKARSIVGLDQSRSTIDLRQTIRNRHSGPEPESIPFAFGKMVCWEYLDSRLRRNDDPGSRRSPPQF